MKLAELVVLPFGMLHLFLCLHLLVIDGCCDSFGVHGFAAVCREWGWMRSKMIAIGVLDDGALLSLCCLRTRLCDADSTGQTSSQGRLRFLVGVVLRSTLATVLAKDFLSEILCLALLTI
jgi:hypothetical protein